MEKAAPSWQKQGSSFPTCKCCRHLRGRRVGQFSVALFSDLHLISPLNDIANEMSSQWTETKNTIGLERMRRVRLTEFENLVEKRGAIILFLLFLYWPRAFFILSNRSELCPQSAFYFYFDMGVLLKCSSWQWTLFVAQAALDHSPAWLRVEISASTCGLTRAIVVGVVFFRLLEDFGLTSFSLSSNPVSQKLSHTATLCSSQMSSGMNRCAPAPILKPHLPRSSHQKPTWWASSV